MSLASDTGQLVGHSARGDPVAMHSLHARHLTHGECSIFSPRQRPDTRIPASPSHKSNSRLPMVRSDAPDLPTQVVGGLCRTSSATRPLPKRCAYTRIRTTFQRNHAKRAWHEDVSKLGLLRALAASLQHYWPPYPPGKNLDESPPPSGAITASRPPTTRPRQMLCGWWRGSPDEQEQDKLQSCRAVDAVGRKLRMRLGLHHRRQLSRGSGSGEAVRGDTM